MEAKDRSIEFLKSSNIIYNVPFFQRGYVWDKDNWSQMFDALISNDEANFLGAVILKDLGTKNDIIYKNIIDGQQRMTTLSILARAINDEFYCPEEDMIAQSMENLIFNVDDIETDIGIEHQRIIKIRHSRKDSAEYELVINGSYKNIDLERHLNNANSSKISRCYCYFRLRIRDVLSTNKALIQDNLIKKMTKENRKSLVIITLGDQDNEQVIFDTINSAGVKLTSSDIIKNALFNQYVSSYNDEKKGRIEAGKLYDNTWDVTFEQDEMLSNLWNQKRTIGKSNERTRLEIFLQAFAIVMGIFDPNNKEHKLEILSDLYKKYLQNKNTNDIKEFTEELCEYANLYKEWFIEVSEETTVRGCVYNNPYKTKFENVVTQTIQILTYLNTTTFDCYVLKLLKEDDENIACEQFSLLNKYLIRNYINEGSIDKNYNKEAANLVNGKTTIIDLINNNELDDSSITSKLNSYISNEAAKLVLYWIELYRNYSNNSDKKDIPIPCNYQLEHIMPQKWLENWDVIVPDVDEFGRILTEDEKLKTKEELSEQRKRAIYKIGNMTLLNETKNKQFSNNSFENKLNGYSTTRGKFITGLKKSSTFLISSDILDKTEWNEETIQNRTDSLVIDILKIWNI